MWGGTCSAPGCFRPGLYGRVCVEKPAAPPRAAAPDGRVIVIGGLSVVLYEDTDTGPGLSPSVPGQWCGQHADPDLTEPLPVPNPVTDLKYGMPGVCHHRGCTALRCEYYNQVASTGEWVVACLDHRDRCAHGGGSLMCRQWAKIRAPSVGLPYGTKCCGVNKDGRSCTAKASFALIACTTPKPLCGRHRKLDPKHALCIEIPKDIASRDCNSWRRVRAAKAAPAHVATVTVRTWDSKTAEFFNPEPNGALAVSLDPKLQDLCDVPGCDSFNADTPSTLFNGTCAESVRQFASRDVQVSLSDGSHIEIPASGKAEYFCRMTELQATRTHPAAEVLQKLRQLIVQGINIDIWTTTEHTAFTCCAGDSRPISDVWDADRHAVTAEMILAALMVDKDADNYPWNKNKYWCDY